MLCWSCTKCQWTPNVFLSFTCYKYNISTKGFANKIGRFYEQLLNNFLTCLLYTSKCRERDERPVWMNVQFGWKSGLDERSVRINVQTGQTSSQDENPVRVKVRFQEQIFLRHLHSSIRGRIFSLVEGLSIRGKLNPRVKNYFPFIQERKGRVVRLSKPKNAWIHIHMYDWVLLQSPEKIDIRRFICYRIRRYTMTSKDSFNSLKHCSRRFWRYPYSEVSGLNLKRSPKRWTRCQPTHVRLYETIWTPFL